MKNSLKVAGWEIKKNIKSKMFLIMAFIFPVIIVAVAGIGNYLAFKEESRPKEISVGIVDKTRVLKSDVKKELTEANYKVSFFQDKSENELKEVIEKEELTGVFVFPEDSLEANRVLFYSKDLSDVRMDFVEERLTSVLAEKRLRKMGYNPSQILNLTRKTTIIPRNLGEEKGIVDFALPFGLAFMMILATLISGGMLLQSIVKEKSDRIVELTLSSITAKDLMMGKILGYASLGIIQIIIWLSAGLIAAQYFFDISLTSLVEFKTIYILLYFVLGYVLLAGLYAIVDSVMKDSKDGNQVGGFINIIPIIPLYFSQLLMSGSEGAVVKFLTYCPIFTPVTMLLRLSFTTPRKMEIISTIVILIVFDYLVIRAASKVFKTAILMYGQSMSFKKIIEVIKS